MPNLAKIAQILGFSDQDGGPTAVEQAQQAIDEATQRTGSMSKIAQILGISEENATQLVAYKIKGDDAAFQALTRKLKISESLGGSGLM